jgi:hypothetical protein
MTEADFAAVHAAIGDAPVGASPSDPINDASSRAELLDARSLIGNAYDFDEANVTSW